MDVHDAPTVFLEHSDIEALTRDFTAEKFQPIIDFCGRCEVPRNDGDVRFVGAREFTTGPADGNRITVW